MTTAAAHAAAFYREVASEQRLWTISDEGGIPAPVGTDGRRAMPFWSSRSRAERIISSVPAYSGFEPFEVSWADFTARWARDLERDGLLVGINWSGKRATGFDIEPATVVVNVEHHLRRG